MARHKIKQGLPSATGAAGIPKSDVSVTVLGVV